MNDMREGNCALCDHDEVVASRLTEFSGDRDLNARPLAITHAVKKSSWFGDRPDPDRGIGILTAYMCRRCGFVQMFASQPASVPIDDGETELVKGKPPPAPYR